MQPSPIQDMPEELSLSRLWLTFLKLGATAFGGPAMLAYIRTVVVEQQQWLAEEPFRAGVALYQTIPGATVIQLAAYVGFRLRGIAGAAASFIGFGLPAFLLLMILSAVYSRVSEIPTAVAALHGLQAIVVAIVAHATRVFGRATLNTWWDGLIALGCWSSRVIGSLETIPAGT